MNMRQMGWAVAMARNRVQFQKGSSEPEFERLRRLVRGRSLAQRRLQFADLVVQLGDPTQEQTRQLDYGRGQPWAFLVEDFLEATDMGEAGRNDDAVFREMACGLSC